MADGGMKDGNRVVLVQDMAQGYPYLPPVNEGVAWVDRPGACDPLMREQYQRENPFRYATAFWRWTRAAGGELTLDASSLQLFQQGADAPADGTGGGVGVDQTRAETNAYDGGGIAKQKNRFVGVAVSVQPLKPFLVATGAVAVGDAAVRRHASWFTGGTDYPAETFGLLADACTARVKHGKDNACEYDFGPLAMLMGQSPMDGYKPNQGLPGTFTYLAVPDVSGNKQDGFNLSMFLTLHEDLFVESNPLNPTVAGFDFITPVRFAFVGFPVCVNIGEDGNPAACGVDQSAQVARMVKQELAVMRAQFQSALDDAMNAARGGLPPGNKGAGRW